jgi:ABC-type polar amino acid transport system ATPase subunit
MTASLTVRGLHLARGDRAILNGVDIEAAAGEIVALMGLSGSGKTTILRVLAGLERPDAGQVAVPKVGMVFQFHFLFEHLSVLDNVCLAPVHVHGAARGEAERRAHQLLDDLGVRDPARARRRVV